MAKTGRRATGDNRPTKSARVNLAITSSQFENLAWLRLKLKLSNADLIGMWIDEAFNLMGGSPVAAAKPQPDRAAAVIKMMVDGVKPDTLTVQQLADDLGVPSERLAALVTKCTCQQGGREGAKFKP